LEINFFSWQESNLLDSFIAIKPDGVQVSLLYAAIFAVNPSLLTLLQRGLIGPIISRFEQRG
jgi:nucleoside diphosphate kinase